MKNKLFLLLLLLSACTNMPSQYRESFDSTSTAALMITYTVAAIQTRAAPTPLPYTTQVTQPVLTETVVPAARDLTVQACADITEKAGLFMGLRYPASSAFSEIKMPAGSDSLPRMLSIRFMWQADRPDLQKITRFM